MFERYTQTACRIIFMARAEAGMLGSPRMETEHLLLGLVGVDLPIIQQFVSLDVTDETFRGPILAQTPAREKILTSVNMPLSNASQRVLAYAGEESDRLGDNHVRPGHLLLGLMRERDSFASRLLARHGAELPAMQRRMAAEPEAQTPPDSFSSSRQPGNGPPPGAPPVGSPSAEKIRYKRFIGPARRVLFFARYEAGRWGNGILEPEHLLLAILREGLDLLGAVLAPDTPWPELRSRIQGKLGASHAFAFIPSAETPLSDAARRVLAAAMEEGTRLGRYRINMSDLLLGLLSQPDTFAAQLLREHGADADTIRRKLNSLET